MTSLDLSPEYEKDGDTVTKGSNVSRQFFLVPGNFSWLDKFFPNFQRFFKNSACKKNHRKFYKFFLSENEFGLKNFLQEKFLWRKISCRKKFLQEISCKKIFLQERFLARKFPTGKTSCRKKTLGHWKYFLPLPEKFLQEEFLNFITWNFLPTMSEFVYSIFLRIKFVFSELQ